MRALRDSARLVGHPDALRRELSQYGYLFLRGQLPSARVGDVATDMTRVLMRHGVVADETGRMTRRGRRLLVDGRITAAVHDDLQSLESLHRLVCDAAVAAVVRALLGPAFVHPQRLIRTTVPVRFGGPVSPAVHRDYPAWRVPDMLTAWCPLSPCPPERGGLCVWESSHRLGLNHPSSLSGDRWATAAYRPGDMLLLHCFTVHGTLPNLTRHARLSVDSRWQRLSDPVPSWATRPDRSAGWEPYTRGWSTTAWVSIPESATVVADDEEWEPLTELPPSTLLDWPV